MRFTCIALAAFALAVVKPRQAPGHLASSGGARQSPAPASHAASFASADARMTAANGVIDFTPVRAEGEPVAAAGLALVPSSDTSRCVTVKRGDQGAKLVVVGCSPEAAQTFTLVGGEIRTPADMCVTAPDSRDNAVRPVALEPCDGSPAQQWTSTDAGEFRGYRGKCLTAAAGLQRRQGTPLAVRGCMARADQRWQQRSLASARHPRVEAIRINAVALSLGAGRTSKMNAAALDADGREMGDELVTWTSSDPSVATVSSTGLVTGVAGGSTTITAMAQGRVKSVAVEVRGAQYAGAESGTATFGTERP